MSNVGTTDWTAAQWRSAQIFLGITLVGSFVTVPTVARWEGFAGRRKITITCLILTLILTPTLTA